MLNIESELRSLRNELEDRNKMFTPNSSRANKLKEVNTSNENIRDSTQNSSSHRNVGNKETEIKACRKSSPITKTYCNSPDSADEVK